MNKRQAASSNVTRSVMTGLAIVAGLLLLFLAVYIMAIRTTLASGDGNFNRVWTWSSYLISLGALIAIARGWQRLSTPLGMVGVILAGLVWLSASARAGRAEANFQAAVTLLAFVGGSVLLPWERGVRVAMLHRTRQVIVQSIGLGLRVSLPLALMGGAYLALTDPGITWRNPLTAVGWAIQPAVVVEVAYRFFILNLCLTLLANRPARTVLVVAIFVLAIVPVSLLEVAAMWNSNPLGAVALVVLYSLLFGLPPAYLQWRRTLEAAITFQWIVSIVRVWAGLMF